MVSSPFPCRKLSEALGKLGVEKAFLTAVMLALLLDIKFKKEKLCRIPYFGAAAEAWPSLQMNRQMGRAHMVGENEAVGRLWEALL